MRLSDVTGPGLIFPALAAASGSEVLASVATELRRSGQIADEGSVLAGLMEREELGSTGIGGGIAIPHCKVEGLQEVVMAVATLEKGVDFAALDGEPVRFFFVVVSPESEPAAHLQCLSAISRWVQREGVLAAIGKSESAEEIYALLAGEG